MAVVVKRKPAGSDDQLIADFKRMILKYKVLDQIKDKLVYLKPSARRNIEKNTKKRRRR